MTDEIAERIAVTLPSGVVEVSAAYGRPDGAWATIAIAHGAGTDYAHPFMIGLCRALHAGGVATLRFNFPYCEAGRRMPGPATHAIATWTAASAHLAARSAGEPVWACGKSYGGRMASMAAADGAIEPAGLVYLGYPLHPPGNKDKLRVEHLPRIPMPQLFVSGTNDPFIDPHAQLEAAVASCQNARIAWVDGGGHSFDVKGRKRPADVIGAELAPLVAGFLREPR